jgi:hypothetical protein
MLFNTLRAFVPPSLKWGHGSYLYEDSFIFIKYLLREESQHSGLRTQNLEGRVEGPGEGERTAMGEWGEQGCSKRGTA